MKLMKTKEGQWLNGDDYEYEFAYCSECGRMQWANWNTHAEAKEKVGEFHEDYKFCPGCGAKMTGGRYVEKKAIDEKYPPNAFPFLRSQRKRQKVSF